VKVKVKVELSREAERRLRTVSRVFARGHVGQWEKATADWRLRVVDFRALLLLFLMFSYPEMLPGSLGQRLSK
jgi:hypothetical protein